jgi:NADH-quinone oxidoreductase subunit I
MSSSSSSSPSRLLSTASGFIKSIESGSKHLVINKRFFTLRYPEQKLKFVGGDVVAVKQYFANL